MREFLDAIDAFLREAGEREDGSFVPLPAASLSQEARDNILARKEFAEKWRTAAAALALLQLTQDAADAAAGPDPCPRSIRKDKRHDWAPAVGSWWSCVRCLKDSQSTAAARPRESTRTRRQRREQPANAIIRLVAHHFGVSESTLRGPGRHRAVAEPRFMAIYLIRELTGLSFPRIGQVLGGRNHSTVMSALKRIVGMIESSSRHRRTFVEVRQVVVEGLAAAARPVSPAA